MALTVRQQLLYIHRIEIWRFVEPDAIAGKPQARVWTKIASDVPCYLEYTESDFGINAAGILAEEDIIWTLDVLHCEISVNLRVGDVIKLTQGARLGFWRVRGNEKAKARRANKQGFRCGIMEAPPLGVS